MSNRDALTSAIRAFTVDMPNDEANGEAEKQLARLGSALLRGDIEEACEAYGAMLEADVERLIALREAADKYFGEDFSAPQEAP